MARWTKNLPTKEGWYVYYDRRANRYDVWHLHKATAEKGYGDCPLTPGSLCWGATEKGDDFPYASFSLDRLFYRLEQPNA